MQIASFSLSTIGTVVNIFVKFIILNHISMSRFETSKTELHLYLSSGHCKLYNIRLHS